MATPGQATSAITGDMVVRIARQHVGDRYVLGVLVPKNNPNWKGPWDLLLAVYVLL